MEYLAGLIAPIATMVAAIMTAANLGSRVTGWGFVIFTIGSLAWCGVALATGQQNLLLTNGFLVLVNGVGIWRWLGRNARHDDGARAAESLSEQAPVPTLVAVSNLVGRKVFDCDQRPVGTMIGIMAEAARGRMSFGIVGIGGIGGLGERLVAIDWSDLDAAGDNVKTTLSKQQIDRRPTVDPENWPIAVV